MSYDIYIGQGRVDVPEEDSIKEGYTELRVDVDRLELDDAPTFPNDEMTGKGNSRHPGYSQWSDFVATAGIADLFFDKESGLMSEHPGAFLFTRAHADRIVKARESWESTHPLSKPGWCSCMKCDGLGEKRAAHEDLDGTLARLIWLEWWFKWTLANCTIPTIFNR